MKKRILIASLFLAAYLLFLLATLPAALVARYLPLPTNIANLLKLEGVSGTLWSGQIARLQYASESVNQLRWDLNGWSLLRFAPEVAIRFGDRNGLNGQGVVGWNGAAFGRDLTLNAHLPRATPGVTTSTATSTGTTPAPIPRRASWIWPILS